LKERLGEELREIAFPKSIKHALHIYASRVYDASGASVEDRENHLGEKIRALVARKKLFVSRLRKTPTNSIVRCVDIKKSWTMEKKKTEHQIFGTAGIQDVTVEIGQVRICCHFGATGIATREDTGPSGDGDRDDLF
jgi:hypothetical protein